MLVRRWSRGGAAIGDRRSTGPLRHAACRIPSADGRRSTPASPLPGPSEAGGATNWSGVSGATADAAPPARPSHYLLHGGGARRLDNKEAANHTRCPSNLITASVDRGDTDRWMGPQNNGAPADTVGPRIRTRPSHRSLTAAAAAAAPSDPPRTPSNSCIATVRLPRYRPGEDGK